jgi:hypothetical protein
MASLRCSSCHRDVAEGQVVCPSCGFLADPVAHDFAGAAGGAPADSESVTVVGLAALETDGDMVCDHAAARVGAVLCPTCTQPLGSDDVLEVHGVQRPTTPYAVVRLPQGVEVVVTTDKPLQVGRADGPLAGYLASTPSVSRRHATISVTDSGAVTVIDQGSTNGTFVNGRRCLATGATEVPNGAEVSFGSSYPVTVVVVR